MGQTLKEILDGALALPPNSRAYVAEILLESLDFEADFPLSDEWRREIERRCREIDASAVDLVPGDEVMEALKARFP